MAVRTAADYKRSRNRLVTSCCKSLYKFTSEATTQPCCDVTRATPQRTKPKANTVYTVPPNVCRVLSMALSDTTVLRSFVHFWKKKKKIYGPFQYAAKCIYLHVTDYSLHRLIRFIYLCITNQSVLPMIPFENEIHQFHVFTRGTLE